MAACAAKSAYMSFLWERVGPQKTYGSHAEAVEGDYQLHDKVLITDDTVTSGGSLVEGIKILHGANLLPMAATLQFDREEGGVERLQGLGLEVNAIVGLSRAVCILRANKRITSKELDALQEYHEAISNRGDITKFVVEN
jgi:orotate phosphoribosyltransferase